MLVNEGANALDFTRSIVDMYKPRKRIDVGTWGIMGVGMGYCVAAAVVSKQQVIRRRHDGLGYFDKLAVRGGAHVCHRTAPLSVASSPRPRVSRP